MKKVTTFLIAFFLVGYVILQFKTPQAFSYSNMPPSGATGSPSDGVTCNISGCHTGTPTQTANGWITSNIPTGGYVAGNTYTITATATYAGRNRFGFEVSPQNTAGTILGTLVNTSTQTAILATGYIGQTSNGLLGTGSKTWTFNWTAPATGTGAVTFYGAFNCANGTGGVGGDFIYTSTLTVQESAVGIASYQAIKGLAVYPSPSTGIYHVNSLNTPLSKIEIFDLTSKKIKTFNLDNSAISQSFTFDLSNQKAGIYLMKITANNKIELKKIILIK